MSKLESFEIVKFGPYRYIGKTVYASNKRGTGEIFRFLRDNSDWVFNELETLKEYASDEPHNVELNHFECYDPKGDGLAAYWKEYLNYETYELWGYTIGRFMKADTPVPEGLNYIDINEIYVAKAWWTNEKPDIKQLIIDELKRMNMNEYYGEPAVFSADIHISNKNGTQIYGEYTPCILKPPHML